MNVIATVQDWIICYSRCCTTFLTEYGTRAGASFLTKDHRPSCTHKDHGRSDPSPYHLGTVRVSNIENGQLTARVLKVQTFSGRPSLVTHGVVTE